LPNLRITLAEAFYDSLANFIRNLAVYVAPPHGPDDVPSLTAIAALLVRLPYLQGLQLEVASDAHPLTSLLLNSLSCTRAQLTTISIDWSPPYDAMTHSAILDAVERHLPNLKTVSLRTQRAQYELKAADLVHLDRLEHLALSGFDLSWSHFIDAPFPPLTAMLSLDVDASCDFPTIARLILPSIPQVAHLSFYLVFPPSLISDVKTLPSLPALPALRILEIRSVAADELEDCLHYLAPLAALVKLIVSADTREIPAVTEVLLRLSESMLEGPGPADLAFAGLKTLSVEWEGEEGVPVSEATERVLEEALKELKPVWAARGVEVVSEEEPAPQEPSPVVVYVFLAVSADHIVDAWHR
jgi:hypothetical protein